MYDQRKAEECAIRIIIAQMPKHVLIINQVKSIHTVVNRMLMWFATTFQKCKE